MGRRNPGRRVGSREGRGQPGPPRQERRPVTSAGEPEAPAPGTGAARVTRGAAGSCIAQKRRPKARWAAGRGGSVVAAHGQVHKREHVELRHDGEAQEYAVQEKAPAPELLVQLPLVQVNAKHLQHTAGSEGAGRGGTGRGGAEEGGGGGRGAGQWRTSRGTGCLRAPCKLIAHVLEDRNTKIKRGNQNLKTTL